MQLHAYSLSRVDLALFKHLEVEPGQVYFYVETTNLDGEIMFSATAGRLHVEFLHIRNMVEAQWSEAWGLQSSRH